MGEEVMLELLRVPEGGVTIPAVVELLLGVLGPRVGQPLLRAAEHPRAVLALENGLISGHLLTQLNKPRDSVVTLGIVKGGVVSDTGLRHISALRVITDSSSGVKP